MAQKKSSKRRKASRRGKTVKKKTGKKASRRKVARRKAGKKASKKKVARRKASRKRASAKRKTSAKRTPKGRTSTKKTSTRRKTSRKKTAKKASGRKTTKRKTTRRRTVGRRSSKAREARPRELLAPTEAPAAAETPAPIVEPARPVDTDSWFLDDSTLDALVAGLSELAGAPDEELESRLRLAGDLQMGGDPVRELFATPHAATAEPHPSYRDEASIPLPEAHAPREALGDAGALLGAARLGRGEEVRRLLRSGVDPDLTDDPGDEHREVISFLCRHEDVGNLDLDGRKLGRTACHVAAAHAHTDVLRALIEGGCDVNFRDHAGETPLMLVARKGFAQLARLLLQAGARIDARDLRGATALLRAAEGGHADVVRLLLEARADVDAHDHEERTPLIASSAGVHEETVRLLLDAAADLGLRDASGADALCAAVCAIEPDEPGTPSPFEAIGEDRILRIVALLLDSGARDVPDTTGVRPSRRAQERGHQQVALLLRERGS